ncbi:MAG: iron-containing alcohol dehydrogenase [Spirochaetia bacterium]|nr:iron-containing alcohol dehydrogenase [Spirochaetia bacterium]
MNSFTIFNPTKIIFGAGEIDRAGAEAAAIAKSAIIITGQGSVKRSGLLDRVTASLKTAGVKSVVYSGVTPNPKDTEVDEAAALAVKERCKLVIGLGGGSAMDAAKGAAIVAANGGGIWDYVGLSGRKSREIKKAIPIMLIPTLAATGSEGNPSAVFSNKKTLQKSAIYSPDFAYPRVSIVDPDTTLSVPAKPTAEGIIDIIMHVLEEYLTGAPDCALQDRMTEGVILTCMESGLAVMKDLSDAKARADISLASTVALQGLPNSGRGGNWAVHPMEHALSALHDEIAHGSGIAAILPSYMNYLGMIKPEKVLQLGDRVFGVGCEIKDELKIPMCIERLKLFITGLGLSDNLKDLGLKPDEPALIAEKVIEISGIPAPIKNKEDLFAILKNAY